MVHQNKSKFHQAGQNTASAIGSYRRYSVLVIIVEVFFRKFNMGERYFNGRSFLGGLVGLILLRFFKSMGQIIVTWGSITFSNIRYFDAFIVAYIVMSLVHFITQWRVRGTQKEEHSYYLGTSRWCFIARGLGIKKYSIATLYVVEPLILFIMAFPILIYSSFLAVVTIFAAIRLWWENAKSINQFWQAELNRRDSIKYGRFVQQNNQHITSLDSKASASDQAGYKNTRKQGKQNSKTSSGKAKRTTPTVQESLNNLSPKLKNLSKK